MIVLTKGEVMTKKEFIDGEIWKTKINTNITDKIRIDIIDTKTKNCCNCTGFGKECDNGYAWIYCEIRSYFENSFDGDCGEMKGCTEFIPFYTKIANKIANRWHNNHCNFNPISQKQKLRNDIINELKQLFPLLESTEEQY